LAAFLYAQLENMDIITRKRQEIYRRYEATLRPLANRGLVALPVIPPECESNYHMFYIVLNSFDERTRLIEHLKTQGILALFHYVPLHTSPMGTAMGYRAGMLPVTETVSERLLRLPMFYEMQESEVESVVSEIFRFFGVV
jgi:dTDP-4-amino-4,6-dideoxygalactose transaminase